MQIGYANNGRYIYKTHEMKYNKIQHIIEFEVAQYLKSHTFLYITILFPLFVSLLLFVSIDKQKPVSLIVQNTTDIPLSLDSCKNVVPITVDKQLSVDDAFAMNKNCQAMLKLSYASGNVELDAAIYKKQKLPLEFYSTIRQRVLNAYADHLHGDSLSIMTEDAKNRLSINQIAYTENPDIKKENNHINSDLTIAAIMLIYFIVFQFSNNIMKSISVEKQNKISEIMLSSVHPKTIILGKIISGYILALIQMVVWGIIICLIVNAFFDVSTLASINQQTSSPDTFPIMPMNEVISFLLILLACITGGYFMYSSLFAIIGAVSNENTDTQKFSFILTMPLVITLIYVIEHLQDCNSAMVILSYFPLTSPIALMARLSSGICIIEVFFSLLILVICMFICIKLSSSIYRNAIIADTEKITIETIIKWLK